MMKTLKRLFVVLFVAAVCYGFCRAAKAAESLATVATVHAAR